MKLTSELAFTVLEKLKSRAHLLRAQCETTPHNQNEFYKESCNYSGHVKSELRRSTNGQWALVSEYGIHKVQITIPVELVDEEFDAVAITKAKEYFKNHFAQKSVITDSYKIEEIVEKIRFLPRNIAHELIDGLVKLKNLDHNKQNAVGYVYSYVEQKELVNSLKPSLDKIYNVN